MQKDLGAFKIRVGSKILDYRIGQKINLDEVNKFFSKTHRIKKLWSEPRHILGILEKSGKNFFLKLSTSEGISVVTQNEFRWNEEFNKKIQRRSVNFWVPQNYDSGFYQGNLFYLITDNFTGELLAKRPGNVKISGTFLKKISQVIEFSILIQDLNLPDLGHNQDSLNANYLDWFINKTESWFNSIPEEVISKFRISQLLEMVKKNSNKLDRKTRHGDFTPWHLVALESDPLGLIDGEHAMSNSVEGYDIGYFIQRVFSVLQNPKLARHILNQAILSGYQKDKLRTILISRAIGGFLDESLVEKPNYSFAQKFSNWIINL